MTAGARTVTVLVGRGVICEGVGVKVTSPDDHDITRGNLCIKGRFGFQHISGGRGSPEET